MAARISIKDLPADLQAKYRQEAKRSKYASKWVTVDGIRFQSKKEARRWTELCLLARAGEIALLRRQVPFEQWVNGKKVMTYWADFTYLDLRTCRMVVEDTKSPPTRKLQPYRTKKRWLAAEGIAITEV